MLYVFNETYRVEIGVVKKIKIIINKVNIKEHQDVQVGTLSFGFGICICQCEPSCKIRWHKNCFGWSIHFLYIIARLTLSPSATSFFQQFKPTYKPRLPLMKSTSSWIPSSPELSKIREITMPSIELIWPPAKEFFKKIFYLLDSLRLRH